MTRVKGGFKTRRRHNKILHLAKGYRGSRSNLARIANEAVVHAGEYAFKGRKLRKRDFRRLWIVRISEILKSMDWTYSGFIHAMKERNITLNRKVLADLVTNHPEVFKKVVDEARNDK